MSCEHVTRLDFNRICRLCLLKDDLTPIFSAVKTEDSTINSLSSRILACVSIEVFEADNMPSQICRKCIDHLESWVQFKETCDRSTSLLQQCLSDSLLHNPSVADANVEDTEALWNNLREAILPDTLSNIQSPNMSVFERESLFGMVDSVESRQSMLVAMPQQQGDPPLLEQNEMQLLEAKKVPSASKKKYHKYYRKRYECGICDDEFSKFSDLLTHDSLSHSHLADRICPVCGRSFVSTVRMETHKRIVHREKCEECNVCGLKSVSKKSLNMHMKLHTGAYMCEQCGATHSSATMLENHMRTHTGEKPFKCAECSKSFSCRQALVVHTKTHLQARDYCCHLCGIAFTTAHNLVKHRKLHSKVRPVMCDLCGKSFKTIQNMKAHWRTHYPKEKQFICPICKHSFHKLFLLVRHSTQHTGSKRFECCICDKKFSRNDGLSKHMLMHSDEKPVSCPNCFKSFRQSRYLKKHVCQTQSSESTSSC